MRDSDQRVAGSGVLARNGRNISRLLVAMAALVVASLAAGGPAGAAFDDVDDSQFYALPVD